MDIDPSPALYRDDLSYESKVLWIYIASTCEKVTFPKRTDGRVYWNSISAGECYHSLGLPLGPPEEKAGTPTLAACIEELKESPVAHFFPWEKQKEYSHSVIVGDEDVMDAAMWEYDPPYEKEEGWVYLAESDTGHYKIGRSKDPDQRIKHFDTQMPVEITEVCSFRADNYKVAEKLLHDLCESNGWREKGEWFNLPEDIVEAFGEVDKFERKEFLAEEKSSGEEQPTRLLSLLESYAESKN